MAVTLCLLAFYALCSLPLFLPSTGFLVRLSRGIVKPPVMVFATVVDVVIDIVTLLREHPLGTVLFAALVSFWIYSYED